MKIELQTLFYLHQNLHLNFSYSLIILLQRNAFPFIGCVKYLVLKIRNSLSHGILYTVVEKKNENYVASFSATMKLRLPRSVHLSVSLFSMRGSICPEVSRTITHCTVKNIFNNVRQPVLSLSKGLFHGSSFN
jgi:hypothetical protein